jgi:glyoxylase-like metal-dependent hydrolase (beta-lactamase superfamily II)
VAIGEGIKKVQAHFKTIFNMQDFIPDGSQFDHLFVDGEEFRIGSLQCTAIHTPGHTPDSMSYHIGDCVFSGNLHLVVYER